MRKNSGNIFFNPNISVFPHLANAKNEDELYRGILEQYPASEYKNENVQTIYEERIKRITNWFWKLKAAGKIVKIDEAITSTQEFLKSLEEEMSFINYAFNSQAELDEAIPKVLKKTKNFIIEKINKKELDLTNMSSLQIKEVFEKEFLDGFKHYGLSGKTNLSEINKTIKKNEQGITIHTTSLMSMIDAVIDSLHSTYISNSEELQFKENYDEEQIFEYAMKIQDRNRRIEAIAGGLNILNVELTTLKEFCDGNRLKNLEKDKKNLIVRFVELVKKSDEKWKKRNGDNT